MTTYAAKSTMATETLEKRVRTAIRRSLQQRKKEIDVARLPGDTKLCGSHGLGLDSQQSVRFTLELEDLGFVIDTEENLLVDEFHGKHRSHTIESLVRHISNLMAKGVIRHG